MTEVHNFCIVTWGYHCVTYNTEERGCVQKTPPRKHDELEKKILQTDGTMN